MPSNSPGVGWRPTDGSLRRINDAVYVGEIANFYTPINMKKNVFYHIAFWMAYLFFKSYLNIEGEIPNLTVDSMVTAISGQAVFLVVKIPMVYTLFFIVDKYLAKQWRMSKTILVTVALFTLCMFLYHLIKKDIVLEHIYGTHVGYSDTFHVSSLLYTLFLLIFTASVAVAIKLVRANLRQRKAEQEMIQRKLETELRFLKAQINPHFLFNTLNNIYALARKRSDQTADVVMKLSGLFRFILYESQKPAIPIADEIAVLENYIEIERIRYNEKLQIQFTRSVDHDTQPVAPLILLPFVENAFKHGASESRFQSYIHIDLQLKEQQLHFICENSKAEIRNEPQAEQIGLVNIRRQLELLYPAHHLDIENTDTFFRVSLQVKL